MIRPTQIYGSYALTFLFLVLLSFASLQTQIPVDSGEHEAISCAAEAAA